MENIKAVYLQGTDFSLHLVDSHCVRIEGLTFVPNVEDFVSIRWHQWDPKKRHYSYEPEVIGTDSFAWAPDTRELHLPSVTLSQADLDKNALCIQLAGPAPDIKLDFPILNDGEKLVWAAVFAKYHDLRNPPPGMATPSNDEQWKKWEQGQIASAVEHAYSAVVYLRKAHGYIEEGFGADSDTYKMFVTMIGEAL